MVPWYVEIGRSATLARHLRHLAVQCGFAIYLARTMKNKAGKMDLLVFAAIIVVWIVLQAWILPRFGVQT